jgi:D-alanyl-D-alanine carboxypeptidase
LRLHGAGRRSESATGKSWAKLVEERIAKPLRLKTFGAFPTNRWVRWGRVGGKREPEVDLATFGASAGLYGSAADVLTFNNALMDGRVLRPRRSPNVGKAILRSDSWLGPMGLRGEACRLRGACAAHRAARGHRRHRRPQLHRAERKVALVILSDRGEFDFGEVWQGRDPRTIC